MKYKLSNNCNGLSKLIKNNHKHNSVRFQAASIILKHFHDKCVKSNLANTFKILAHYSISLATFINRSPLQEKQLSASMISNENPMASPFKPILTPPHHQESLKSKGINLSFGGVNKSLLFNQGLAASVQTNCNSVVQTPIINKNQSQNNETSTPIHNKYFGASTASSFKKSLPLPVGALKDLQSYQSHQSQINTIYYNSNFQSMENSPSKNMSLPPSNKNIALIHKERTHSCASNSDNTMPTHTEIENLQIGQMTMTSTTFGLHSAHGKSCSSAFPSESSPYNENKESKENLYTRISPLNLSNFPGYMKRKGSVQDSAQSRESDNQFGKYVKLYKEGDHSSLSSLASSMTLSSQQLPGQSKSPKKISFIQYRNTNTQDFLKGEEKSMNGGHKLSEKTKRFLEEMDLNRYGGQNGKRSQRTKNEILNKSDIGLKGKNENLDPGDYSVNMSVNLNKRINY